MPGKWTEQWWNEFARNSPGPWKLTFSDPACRRLSALNDLSQPPDWQPLKDLLGHLQREGIPAGAPKIRSKVPIYRLSAGEFQLQVNCYPDDHRIAIERLKHPLV